MNWFDIIVAIPLVWAVWRGFSNGLVRQLLAIVALIGGVWVAWRWGATTGEALGMGEQWAEVGGFVVVLIAVMIVIALVGHFARSLFNFVGLGALDNIGGVLFSVAKVWVVVSVVLHWLVALPVTRSVITEGVVVKSALYAPLEATADALFPYIDFAKEQIMNPTHDPIADQTQN